MYFVAKPNTDAFNFLDAAGITRTDNNSAIIIGIANLTTDLKNYGIWNKMKAIYPMVGSTVNTLKFNLKDPRDIDAAYRLTFSGPWVYSVNGITGDGNTTYANTALTPSSALSLDNSHMSIYLNTNNTPPGADPTDIGSFQGSSQAATLSPSNLASLGARFYGSGINYAGQTTRAGLACVSRISSTLSTLYKNGINVASGNSGGSLPTIPIYLGTINYGGGVYQPTNNTIAFASIGDGLTDTEAANLYTAVQRFQTTLGRQV